MLAYEQRKVRTCCKNTYIIRLPRTWPEELQAAFVGNQCVITSQAEQACMLCLQNPGCSTGKHGQGPFGSTTYFILEIIFGHCTFKNLLWLSIFWWLHLQLLWGHDPPGKPLYPSQGVSQAIWHRVSFTVDIEGCAWYKECCTGQNRGWYMWRQKTFGSQMELSSTIYIEM